MYSNISSMQNTSKLRYAHTHRNEAFILKSQSLFASSPGAAVLPPPQQWDCIASQHRCRRCQVSPPCAVRVWLSEAVTWKGVSG